MVSVAFSPGGHTLASGSVDGTVRLWDVTDPAHPRPLGQPLTGGSAAWPRWRSAPIGTRWPPAASRAPSGCGMSPIPRTPARSARPLTGAAVVASVAFSPDRAHAGHRQRRWHHPPLEPPSDRPDRRQRHRPRWRSAPIGTRWPAARRRRDPAVGRHRSRAPPPARPAPDRRPPPCASVAFSPDRAHAGQRRRRRRHPAVGRRRSRAPPPARPAPDRRQRRGGLGGVQPGRAHAGQRQRRRRGPAVGCHRSRAPPPARPAPDRRHGTVVPRWRSAPAGARWPPAARTAPSGCGTSPIPRTPARSASP